MRPEHVALWERIEAFDIDGPPAPALPFAGRLARENGWTPAFAARAVREYRRFVFLTRTAGRPMCPSEQVDQVWHLHLTYTRSYWQRLCGEVLQAPLHHEPTRGGPDEGRKHWAMYADTLAAYREAFGEDAPADLWPPADRRFGDDLAVRKVNPRDYWLVRKPHLSRPALAGGAAVAAAGLAVGCGGAGNPFDLVGVEFLPFFFAVWAAALVVGLLIRRVNRGPGRNPEDPEPELGPYEVAYLKGGRPRVLAAAMVRLRDQGHADVAADGHVIIRNVPPMDADRVEADVFTVLAKQSGNQLDLKPLTQAVKDLEDARFARLREEGFLPNPTARVTGVVLPLMLCLGVVGLFGVTRLLLGLERHKPVGFLVVSLIVTAVVSLVAVGRPIRRTRKADAVLANLSQRHARLRKLSSDLAPGDAALAVGLFGVGVLGGTAYAHLHSRMQKFDSTGAGGGCGGTSGCSATGCGGGGGGGGDGGGGCGGGGCGGCGGGGGD